MGTEKSSQVERTIPEENASIVYKGYIDILELDSFNHFPVLFYNIFYLSFGWIGVFLGFIIIKYFLIVERIIRKNVLRLILFLPIFSWHLFMILRGALDISSSGIVYALWINTFIYLLFKFYRGENITGNK